MCRQVQWLSKFSLAIRSSCSCSRLNMRRVICKSEVCSTQLPVHQRMNANGVRYQMIYFPETYNTIKHDSPYGCKCRNYYTMLNNTHSVHKRLLKMWRARLLCLWPSRYVYPPPLSEANCPPFPSPGGLGPPASKMVSFSPGSTHTPSLPSVTRRSSWHVKHVTPYLTSGELPKGGKENYVGEFYPTEDFLLYMYCMYTPRDSFPWMPDFWYRIWLQHASFHSTVS